LTSHRDLISTCLFSLVALAAISFFGGRTTEAEKPTLAVVVMDPLAAPLACDCVQGYAQRKYEVLAASLEDELDMRVELAFAEGLESGLRQTEGKADLVIGKDSVVRFDAKRLKLPLASVAALTGADGETTQFGLFVVPKDDPAQATADLRGYTILFGPPEADEKHAAAIAALKKAGVPLPEKPEIRSACSDGALEIIEEKFPGGAAAVISSYAKPLLEGCGTIDPGELRAIGKTDPVPFVVAFVHRDLDKKLTQGITELLLSVGDNDILKTALETKSGFVPVKKKVKPTDAEENAGKTSGKPRDDWPCFRGPNRDAIVPWLPQKLPTEPKVVWTTHLGSPALAGVVATHELVIVADRSFDDSTDIWRCLDAKTGEEKWKLEYEARGDLDYGNSPRATPLIDGDRVFLVGAFGDVHCVKLVDGEIAWKKNACIEFGVKPLTWGMCHSPIIVDGKLILGPGAPEASVVALDPKNGETVWKTPGRAAAYASFVDAKLGGVRQLVGYDSTTAGGWDIATGKRLWELVPEEEGDFNVPTPIVIGKRLYLASENNGSRLYDFDDQGRIIAQHTAHHWDLAPDTATPVVVENRIYGCWGGEMFCLNADNNLETLWTGEDDGYIDHVSLFAGSGRILVASAEGELLLVAEKADGYELISRAKLFDGSEVLSHPALVGKQLFIRDGVSIRCVLLNEEG
jgi:outer membrane protein assembly factor BamB